MNETVPQPKLRISALAVGGLLLIGIGAAVLYGPGMIPIPEFPTMSSSEPQVEVVQLSEEFSRPVQRVSQPIVATAPPITATPPIIQQVMPSPDTTMTTRKEATPTTEKPSLLSQLNPFDGLAKLRNEAQAPQATTAAPAPQPPATKPTPKRWAMLATPTKQETAKGQRTDPGLQEDDGETPTQTLRKTAGGKTETSTSTALIHPARWEIPANPLKTIYRSQTLTGVLLQAVHSEKPGQVVIQLTTPVFNKFGYDVIILDKGTLVIASQSSLTQYGDSRLGLKIEQLELPTGEVVDLRATVGDDAGTNGMQGKVNNHYGKLILGVGLNALLNIGIKSAVGTPGRNQFFRNPLEDAAQDVAQATQEAATGIINREMQVRPTITIPAGTFCTINLLENMQFNRPPHVAR